jgi:hypothetical protein
LIGDIRGDIIKRLSAVVLAPVFAGEKFESRALLRPLLSTIIA